MRDALQPIVLSRACGAAFQYTAFDCPSTPSNSPVSVGGAGKRTQFLHRLGTALFLVPSSEPNLRKPRNLSQRRRCVAHDSALGPEPNGRLEEPWRSAPRKIRKARLSTKCRCGAANRSPCLLGLWSANRKQWRKSVLMGLLPHCHHPAINPRSDRYPHSDLPNPR